MREILLAFAAIALISIGADFALNEIGFSSQDRTSGQDVRLD